MLPAPVPDEPNAIIMETSQPFGSIKWIISDYKKFTIWQATYDIKHPVQLKITANKECLGLFFALKSDLRY